MEMCIEHFSYSRSRWLDKQFPSWWERLLNWWRGIGFILSNDELTDE